MLELFGIVFGGASRLAQHWMELKDKDKERHHESVMFDKQIDLQNRRAESEQELRRMDADSAKDAGELDALIGAIRAQADEATKAGGFVAKLSASVRPVISYWLILLYSIVKIAAVYLAISPSVPFTQAILGIYTEFDGALLGSVVSFWFADRSLRKGAK
jgi:hypothetical protein